MSRGNFLGEFWGCWRMAKQLSTSPTELTCLSRAGLAYVRIGISYMYVQVHVMMSMQHESCGRTDSNSTTDKDS
ncbi:hypothetical protein CERZMDRAFT_91154 [Cercospora zeae-maydis SCOH1-5]|uniref:Uncharacterized protein n=1 Tax=Cercospora zeae-maydis SCOH1-5 TaxID=717836 RepID=A0A6A6FAD6_9PEZI|nr:hypothetical protein CERZMDRAFT_91154 [Cercospora zeae-maydis SCOH1-5]